MNRFLWPLIAFAALAAVLAVGLKNSDQKGVIVSPLIGKPAPTFDAPNLLDAKARVNSAQLRGSWHLVNVWGTWCVECRAEHEVLLAIRDEGRVPIVGLNWKDTDGEAQAWLAQLGNPYALIGTDHVGRIAIDWGVYGAPESFLVSPEGIVVEKRIGAMTLQLWRQRFLTHVPAAVSGAGGARP